MTNQTDPYQQGSLIANLTPEITMSTIPSECIASTSRLPFLVIQRGYSIRALLGSFPPVFAMGMQEQSLDRASPDER